LPHIDVILYSRLRLSREPQGLISPSAVQSPGFRRDLHHSLRLARQTIAFRKPRLAPVPWTLPQSMHHPSRWAVSWAFVIATLGRAAIAGIRNKWRKSRTTCFSERHPQFPAGSGFCTGVRMLLSQRFEHCQFAVSLRAGLETRSGHTCDWGVILGRQKFRLAPVRFRCLL
jgi:hypothetical protein